MVCDSNIILLLLLLNGLYYVGPVSAAAFYGGVLQPDLVLLFVQVSIMLLSI